MSAKRQKNRGEWKDSSDRKVSPVEAAFVTESYLIDQKFTNTLAVFRGEAASLLSSVKNAPKQVKSLSNILHSYVVVREELGASVLQVSKLEQALKDEKMNLLQERNRIQMLVHQMHESLAIYQAGYIPQSSPPQQPVIMLPVGHTTPPGTAIGPGLSRTPGCAAALIVTPATKKRKNAVTSKTLQIAPIPDNTTPSTAASKKARQHVLPAVSPPGAQPSPPWPMCGIRKTSLNTVRPVQSKSSRTVPDPTTYDPKSLCSNPSSPPDPQQPQIPLISPLSTSKSLPCDAQAQSLVHQAILQVPISQPARTTSNLSSPTTRTEDPCHPDPKTPSPTSASHSVEHPVPDQRCSTDDPHARLLKEGAIEGNVETKCGASDHPSSDHPTASQAQRDECFLSSSNDGETHKSVEATQGQTSPDSRACVGTRGMKPSKTMRPLDFSSGKSSSEGTSLSLTNFLNHESPSDSPELLAASPRTDSPAQSDVSHTDYTTLGDEAMPQLSVDLESIDDILACLDDTSFSALVGDMLTDGMCTVDNLPSSEGDADRSLIGEDSFGFHCIVDRVNSQPCSSPQLESILSARDVNTTTDGSPKSKSAPSPSKHSSPLSAEKTRKAVDKENVPI